MGQEAADVFVIQCNRPIFHQAPEPVLNADHLGSLLHGRLGHAADRRVQTGAIAARRQNSNAFCFAIRHASLPSLTEALLSPSRGDSSTKLPGVGLFGPFGEMRLKAGAAQFAGLFNGFAGLKVQHLLAADLF